MNTARYRRPLLFLLLLGAGAALVWGIQQRLTALEQEARRVPTERPVPVEVAPIEFGPIERRRTFTGTLEARAEFLVAPKVSGRVEQLRVDLGDAVGRGEVVAVLDDAEYVQAVASAQAELEVARASHAEAESLLRIAVRELERVDRLRERGVTSESQRDAAKAEQLAKQALVKVTEARIARAVAELEAARIRLGYTQVSADWRGGSDRRVVAERYIDEGETVTANAPLLRIVELDPITAVFFVTERDYALLRIGQRAELATDAFPDEVFAGEIRRIAPVFRETTRQARVEMRIDNGELRLKPGMFARATAVLDRVEQAVIVPEQALTRREGGEGVFVVGPDDGSARWRPVRIGARQDGRVQVEGGGLEGRVVVLGQQLLKDGSAVRIAEPGGALTP